MDARVRRYAETLASDGAQVDIICVLDPSLKSHPPITDNIHIYSIPFSRKGASQGNYLIEYTIAFFLYFAYTTWLHIRHRYHVIHVHNMPDFLVFAAFIPRLLGTRIILDIHDIMPDFYMSKFRCGSNHWMVRLLKLQERLSTAFAHTVITACRGFKQRLIQRGLKQERLTVIYNTPDREIFNRHAFAKTIQQTHVSFTLIYPGTQAPRYGLDIPIRALPLMIAEAANIRLQIIGPHTDYTDELIQLAKALGVENYVEFRPPVPVKQIPSLLALADVGIYPALREPYMDIAVPEKVFEYALMGLPIVATRLSVLEDFFSDLAILYFESGTIEQFAERVLRLYRDPQLAKKMVNQADREYVQNFGWEKGKEEYYQLLGKLLAFR